MDKTNKSRDNPAPKPKRFGSIGAIVSLVCAALLYAVMAGYMTKPEPVKIDIAAYSQFSQDLGSNRVGAFKGVLGDTQYKYQVEGGGWYLVYGPPVDNTLLQKLDEHKVKDINLRKPPAPGFFSSILGNPMWIFIFVIVGITVWQARRQSAMMKGASGQGGMGSQADAFGKSKAVINKEENIKVLFSDVYAPDATDQMREAVELLKDPERFAALGGKMPRGAALVGPPGTGKTLLAKAVAGEAKVPFLSLSGSDFAEMFVGVAAARVRDLFEQGKANAPCIIFIDEVDSIAGKRSASPMGGEKETEGGLNALLAQLDGFGDLKGVLFMCATNRAENLDPALMRPGRIDRIIELMNPDLLAREQIFKIHMRGKPVSEDVSARDLARGTSGMNGGQLAAICNEAALCAGRKKNTVISMKEFEEAKDRILMGRENKSLLMTESEKELTAAHEAGHTIVGYLSPEHDPVYKVSIIPRSGALGITMYLPERDRVSMSKRGVKGMLYSLYGGRVAEEIYRGPEGVTTGAQNDEQRATSLAENMIRLWDMADNPLLRHRTFAEDGSGLRDLGGRGLVKSAVSDETAKLVDDEIRAITHQAYDVAKEMLESHRSELDVMTRALLKWETIGVPQVNAIMEGKPLEEVPPPVGFEEKALLVEQKAETTIVAEKS